MEITMYDTLLQLPLFQGLCNNDFTNILSKVKLHFHKYEANETIVAQGELCSRLIFLLNGEITSESTDKHHSYALCESFESPFVIEPYSLFGMHTTYTATYKTHSNAHLVSIDKAFILSELNNYEIFRINYLNILSNRAQTAYDKLWNNHIGNTQEKIADFLALRVINPYGKKTLHIKMEVLAQLIDETRINVSKALNEMQDKGIVTLNRKEIIIPALEKLIEYAKN